MVVALQPAWGEPGAPSMAMYAWPANVANHQSRFVASLVDWPGIIGSGPTVNDAVIDTMGKVSDSVRQRISDRVKIPAPSELKPGQIQVPLDDDANARLEAYLDEIKDKSLKKSLEIDQANRDKRAAYLTEHRINLEPVERQAQQADHGSIEFASIALKAGYVLNGGGLVAIPAILKLAEGQTALDTLLLSSVVLFVIGIVLTCAANYFAYRSMFVAAEGHVKEIEARVIIVADIYYPPKDPSSRQQSVLESRAGSQSKLNSARISADIGLRCWAASVFLFIAGVGVMILRFAC